MGPAFYNHIGNHLGIGIGILIRALELRLGHNWGRLGLRLELEIGLITRLWHVQGGLVIQIVNCMQAWAGAWIQAYASYACTPPRCALWAVVPCRLGLGLGFRHRGERLAIRMKLGLAVGISWVGVRVRYIRD